MTHLDILRKALDDIGVEYVVRSEDRNWTFLFLCSQASRQRFESEDVYYLCRTERFFEFHNGNVVSY